MKLLDEIIDLLSSESGSLTSALLKTKVLMHKIGHVELTEWVNDELNGYAVEKPLPAYRVIPVRLVGHLRSMLASYPEQTMATGHLTEKLRKDFSRDEVRQSIRVVEELVSKTEGHLIRPIAPEFFKALSKPLSEGVWIEGAWTQMEPTQLLNTLIEVRSRLLDFVLNLQGKLGDIPEDNMKEAAKGIDANGIFQAAVFGDNATVIVGHNNSTTFTNTVTKGDFSSLAETLRKAGVDDADVTELQSAVAQDDTQAVTSNKQYGPKVKAWMAKMSGKAIDGAWSIGLSASGQLLATAIGTYYGINS